MDSSERPPRAPGAAPAPAPAASGRLEKTPLAHLLVYAHERNLGGTLELEAPATSGGPGETAAILFVQGHPSKVRTSAAVAYLGRVLLEMRIIDQGVLDRTLVELSKTRRLHGQILLEARAIRDDQLVAGLRTQLLRKLQHTFSMPPETQYRYFDGYDALAGYGGEATLKIDPIPLIWSAVRGAPPWAHISNALTRVTTLPLRLSRRAELSRFDFAKAERELIDLLRAKPMRVAELTATGVLKPRETQLLVYCLLITRQIQVVQEGGPDSVGPRLDATPTARPSPVRPNSEQANAMSFALRAPAQSVPDRTPPERMSPVYAPPSGKASVAPPAPPASAPLTPELTARKQEIVARAAVIDREDYFMMLALPRDATPEQARDAYFRLAKTWHPDRLPAQLGEVRDACARIFTRLSEAQQTLTDPKKRENYMRLIKDGGATPEAQATITAVLDAATSFQKAEVCLRRNDLAQAEVHCRKAHDADPGQPDYLALLAWLESMKPEAQSPEGVRHAIAMLDRALAINERCEKAYFYRGMLHKRVGSHPLAARDFRKSAELNPRNIDAVREVRLYEMRKERGSIPPGSARSGDSDRTPPEKPSGGGLFGRLFKK